MNSDERGSVVLESVFALAFLLTLLLGVVQIVFTIYSRNIVQSAAHEAARSAGEVAASERDAVASARRTVERAAGRLLSRVHVRVASARVAEGRMLTVTVGARLRPIGPFPLHLPITAVGRSFAPHPPR